MIKSQLNEPKSPKLRFKEFSLNWERKIMTEISKSLKSGGTPKSDNLEYYKGTIPFLSISDMNSKYLVKTNKNICELAINNSSSYILPKNNLILSIYASFGIPIINKIDVALPQSVLGFIFNQNYNNEFIYYLFLDSYKLFKTITETGSQPNISLKNIKKLLFMIPPSISEQQKIANFFSLLDKQIELWETKLQLNELKKKYFLNGLFFENYMTKLPKFRFKGFKEPWKMERIKDFSLVSCGKTPSTKNFDYWCINGIPFVTPTDICSKYQTITERFITPEGLRKSQTANTGSVFVTCVASIGKNAICLRKSSFNQQICNVFSKIYNNEFLYYCLGYNKKLILSLSSSSATQIINKSTFENLVLVITPNINEQQKIVKFLSLLDMESNCINNIINMLKFKKNYYLNRLFI